jgi:hypothetical protein
MDVTKEIIAKSKGLIEYVDHNRDEARMSGVETIGIELSSILEGGRLLDVQDALEDAAETGRRPEVTLDAFSKLRRAELLVSEADLVLARFLESPKTQVAMAGSGLAQHHHQACLHGCPSCGKSMLGAISDIPPSILILGIIGAGAIIALVVLALTRK